jgi:threonine/homoserine/homoserine lactone efflux protein
MSADLLLALILFALVSSLTPGPNNMMLLSSGLTFGFRRTIPHMAGVVLGHSGMVFAIGLGLGQLFTRHPEAYTVLKIGGAAYMLYLAWRIARSGEIRSGDVAAQPFGFVQAALFQWINPKGVIMAITVVSLYTVADNYMTTLAICALAFLCSNIIAVSVWTGFGMGLRRFLSDPVTIRRFNLVMAGLLVLSLVPMLWA